MADVKMVDMSQNGSDMPSWGLQIRLDATDIGNLGLEDEDMEIGAEVDFQIEVEVVDVSKIPGKGKVSGITFQIKRMGEIEEDPDTDNPEGDEMDVDNEVMASISKKSRKKGASKNVLDEIGGVTE